MTTQFVHLLDATRRRSLRMASLVEDMLEEAAQSVLSPDEALAERVISRDRDVDEGEVEVESEVIRLLALYQPVGRDLRLLCTILKVNNDLERIADCAVNMAQRAKHLPAPVVHEYAADLRQMCVSVRQSVRRAVEAYNHEDVEVARLVMAGDAAVNALYVRMIRRVIVDTSTVPDVVAAHLDILSVAKNLERIADHACNVAEDVVFLCTGQIVRHEHGGRQTGPANPPG
ncbi:MAG TPA: phosphate signaling complex protein PhoU [Phycisphaerae bacterium]|nr:phosphate signaling complex protein PhoU [Phycisphaerae bacterium]HNU46876.1 phosphate signaling complex protein PhoU [Phycisphaerae bacterium]